MNIEEFRNYCLSFEGVTEEFPFDQSILVFKVYGKIFVLTDIESFRSINLKCDPEQATILRDKYPSVLPGYHMNKKHWNTVLIDNSISNQNLKNWIKDSYDLVLKGIPAKKRTLN